MHNLDSGARSLGGSVPVIPFRRLCGSLVPKPELLIHDLIRYSRCGANTCTRRSHRSYRTLLTFGSFTKPEEH